MSAIGQTRRGEESSDHALPITIKKTPLDMQISFRKPAALSASWLICIWVLSSLLNDNSRYPIVIDRERIARFCVERGFVRFRFSARRCVMTFDRTKAILMCWLSSIRMLLRGVGLNYFGFADELGTILGTVWISVRSFIPVLRERVYQDAVKP